MRRLVMSLLVCLLVITPVSANGGQVRVADQAVGQYLVTVSTSPAPLRAGPVDISVIVQDQARQTVNDARVTVTTEPLGHAGPGGSYPATRDQATVREFYAAKFNLPAAGQWRMQVDITGPQGAGSTSFDVEASSAALINGPVLFVVLGLVPLAIAWRLAQAQRRRLGRSARIPRRGFDTDDTD